MYRRSGLHHEPRQGRAALCHHGASGKRRGARDRRQRGQRQRLRAGRHGERPPHGKGGGQASRRGGGRRGRRLDRRDRPAPAGRVHRAAPARACAVRRRFGEGQPRDYDDRYQAQDRGGRVHRRRQDLPPGRHLQGQRHDPPQHGHHAVLPDDRLRHHA